MKKEANHSQDSFVVDFSGLDPSPGRAPFVKELRKYRAQVGRYLRELGMPPLAVQEEGLTKGTSCPSHCPRSGAS